MAKAAGERCGRTDLFFASQFAVANRKGRRSVFDKELIKLIGGNRKYVAYTVLLMVLGMLAINAGGWQNWMPASDAGYGLYYEWFSPLPAMLAACGIGLAGIVWLCALVALAMASRRAAQNTKRSTVEQSGKP